MPYNLKEKQGPQNRLVLRVFDLYFKKLNFFTIFLTKEKPQHIFFEEISLLKRNTHVNFWQEYFSKFVKTKQGKMKKEPQTEYRSFQQVLAYKIVTMLF